MVGAVYPERTAWLGFSPADDAESRRTFIAALTNPPGVVTPPDEQA